MRSIFFTLSLAASLMFGASWAPAAALDAAIPVNDSGALQAALNNVPDGGVIELAPGTYTAPTGGFTMFATKGFTLRASSNGAVTLNGNGRSDIFRLANGTMGSGRAVTFSGLTFEGGLTTENFIGGALTLVNTEAVFTDCNFRRNAANPGTTGGGAIWINNAAVGFLRCTFTGNTSKNYGGAMSALHSRVYVRDSRFSGNRVDLPNHTPNSCGGALFVNTTSMRIANCSFDDNHAGYVGGAIYTLGEWKDPVSTPAVDLLVSDSSFTNNSAVRDPSVRFNTPPAGGAVHIEDQTTARFLNCRFTSNSARQGGAISSYRAITDIEGCVFKNNAATVGGDSADGIGGTIISLSSDNVEPTTGNGRINRRVAELRMKDSIVSGPGRGASTAREGGGIFASGDLNAAYGLGGITRNGTPDDNKAIVTLTRVAFYDLVATGSGVTPGTGGAVRGDFTKLTADHCIFSNNQATTWGGGLEFVRGSKVTLIDSTISDNFAGHRDGALSIGGTALGGGVTVFGGELNMDRCNIVGNSTPPESAVLNAGGFGSAMATSIDGGANYGGDMSGLIQNCVISDNGPTVAIYDGEDPTVRGTNRLSYSSNTFFPGDRLAFYGDLPGLDYLPVGNLNLLLARSGKSDGNNTAASSQPSVGSILMIPQGVLQIGAPGEAVPVSSHIAYASSGGSIKVNGGRQSGAGAIATAVDGAQTLAVDAQTFVTIAPPPSAAVNIATRLPVGTGADVLIGGFIITGDDPKTVLLRGIGPSLGDSGVAGSLSNPRLDLFDDGGRAVASNDDWRSSASGGLIAFNQATDIKSTGIAPMNDLESAMLVSLAPGVYTAKLQGVNETSGVGLIEVYDLDASPASKLANISTRGSVRAGDDVMIGGFFLLGGPGETKVVVRALGPSLAAQNVANPLADPTLEVVDGNGARAGSNDDWNSDGAAVGATGLAPGSNAESALLLKNLARGPYTAIVQGKNGGTGVGLVEVYVFQ